MLDESRLAIHQVTLRNQWSFRESIEGLERHGVHATAIWREKLQEINLADAIPILRNHKMNVLALVAGGLVTSPDKTAYQAAIDENRRLIEATAALGAGHLVILSGGLEDGSKDIDGARARALDAIASLVPDARAAGIKLGLEPLHPMICANRSVLCTLEQTNDWLDQLAADDAVGVIIDTYHVWWDPNIAEQIARAGKRICAFHVSDWLPKTKDLRLDRGMMGDGVIDIPSLRSMVESAGYDGPCEVEIFSAGNWWRRDPDEVIEIIKERYRKAV
jgi:sugar phosphate isomerase/epimerase